jgi:phosphoglycolate phosphatase-like HAD superfamily hydrolase
MKLAKNADVKAIAIDSGSEELDDLSDAGADIIVKSVALLPEILL